MYSSELILNEFYQGLKLLIEFETGKSRGALNAPFYALNKVVAHFISALENGDVIAPFFLHYIADKFPLFVDKSKLPDLAGVPSHKSQAPKWIEGYQDFLNLYQQVNKLNFHQPDYPITVAQADLRKKHLRKQFEEIRTQSQKLMKSKITISGVLAAKVLELLQEKTNLLNLDKLIVEAFEESAFSPNIYAMYEYARFIQKRKLQATHPARQKKLEVELSLLANNKGDMDLLLDFYNTERNEKFLSQWLFQSAIHAGRNTMAIFMLKQYIFNDVIQWFITISKQDRLAEAIKWFNWFQTYTTDDTLQIIQQEIAPLALNYRQVIGEDKYKAAFLCYVIDQIHQQLYAQSITTPESVLIEQNMDLLICLQHFREIIKLTWKLNGKKLPSESSSIVINEMAIILEADREYVEAENLFRKVYALDSTNPIHQFNLANILFLQNKNKKERKKLYFAAARQGCCESVQCLFKLLVIDGYGSVKELEALKDLIESLNSDMGWFTLRSLLISLITTTIFQKLNNKEVLKWTVVEKEGKEFFSPSLIIQDEKPEEDHAGFDTPEGLPVESSQNNGKAKKLTASPDRVKAKPIITASASTARMFKPVKDNDKSIDAKKERALKILKTLNDKPVRTLRIKDFIAAKKAYQILMGEAGGIEISHKGRTSGSRAIVAGTKMHLTHGRDRMSIGAQSDIKEVINQLTKEAKSEFSLK